MFLLVLCVHLLFVICVCSRFEDNFSKDDIKDAAGHREKREFPLLFHQNNSVVNFICGFGVPVRDLQLESVNTGIVFKSQYFLPASVADLVKHSTQSVNGRNADWTTNSLQSILELKQRQNTLSKYRWSIYRGMEQLAEHLGFPGGRSCVLKSICEAAETPFRYESGLLGEVMHIILTPSTSADELTTHADNAYLNAEHLGRTGANCADVFRECSTSILANFSQIFEFFLVAEGK